MKVYLDLCCLKRPFDDQSQSRIAVETAAVLANLKLCTEGRLEPLRSTAHDLENSRTPIRSARPPSRHGWPPSPPHASPRARSGRTSRASEPAS